MKMLKNAWILILMCLICSTAFAGEREEKIVYHISDSIFATQALNNVRNHLKQSPKAKIVVVTHGAGIDFLLEDAKDKNGNPYDIMVQELAAKKVEFRVCNNTLTGRKIDKSKVLPEATIVPSGVAEISRLQFQEGFGYIKP
ncbi:MAG: DsrE family protein [Undibacterium sp.]|nr:DsrE family protein [Undibacterium sp.]